MQSPLSIQPAACSTKSAPAPSATCNDAPASAPACASSVLAEVQPPSQRYGTPRRRNNCPPAMLTSQVAAEPQSGRIDRIENGTATMPPMTGAPGFTSCAVAKPNSTSANDCASAPASVAGAVMPSMTQDATSVACPV